MLQQTRVAAVIPYYERFLERFPDVRALAEAPEEEVLRLWSGLGYYSRARNLQKAAQEIAARHGGTFPRSWVDALSLPGIGDYTAAAILSIAYGEKHAVLDGNVARVVARLEARRGDLRQGGRWQELQKMADEWLDRGSPGEWNQAMMELGATVCTPRAPQCLLCPVSKFCEARRLGLTDRIPEKRKKRTAVEVKLVAAVFLNAREQTLLLPPPTAARNNAADDVPSLVSRMWHFPTKAADGNSEDALRKLLREISSSRWQSSSAARPLRQVRHTVTFRSVSVLPFRVCVRKLPGVPGAKILRLVDISSLPVSNLTRKVAKAALEGLLVLALKRDFSAPGRPQAPSLRSK